MFYCFSVGIIILYAKNPIMSALSSKFMFLFVVKDTTVTVIAKSPDIRTMGSTRMGEINMTGNFKMNIIVSAR